MLFNSGTFLQFFAAFVLLYYSVRNHLRARNILVVCASYLFYGWWDYRFLSLLVASSLLDYAVGLGLERLSDARQRKLLVGLSIFANLAILGFFKYYNFFSDSFAQMLRQLDLQVHPTTLQVILPVGISFYTFQTMSYAIDVYRRTIKPTHDLVAFLAFVSFFPQLVAGPIERAHHLLPQFTQTRRITRPMLEEGMWLCIWGLFKKVVLADNLAPLVEMVYDHSRPGGIMVALATLAFGLQIYCDFSGYSDIARGTARLLGFDIMINFKLPYVATNLREFWSRWHISLSTWLRDYLYVSLGGNRHGRLRTYRNLFTTMVLGGLWHGAAWNFIAWGAWHGLGLVLHRWWVDSHPRREGFRAGSLHSARPARAALVTTGSESGSDRIAENEAAFVENFALRAAESGNTATRQWQKTQWGIRLVRWLATMAFVFYGWLLFRAGSWQRMVALTQSFGDFVFPSWTSSYCINLIVFAAPLVAMQIWQYRANDLLAPLRLHLWARTILSGVLLIAVVVFWQTDKVPFIYFQF